MTPKKLHRFLIEKIPSSDSWVLDDEHVVHQGLSILKFKIGESFIVFADKGPDITVELIDRDKRSMTVKKIKEVSTPALPRTIIAAISIAKGASFELAVQKLTEIGVSAIVPILSERTVKTAVRLDRLQKISNEALELSGGNTRVTIHEPMTLEECFATFPHSAFVCDGYEGDSVAIVPETAVLYVGPEGGWSLSDEAVFEQYSITRLKLGEKVLRTETAAIIGAYTLLWHS
ncbi:MAG TPA: RsmE family RNA methyltransferase [Candidatus Paceibacterota bacterium]